MTFLEIYETFLNGKRIVAFQIPPATRGIPTTWNGAAYAREDESTCALPLDKMDLIRSQIGVDWSKEIVPGATMDDLDEQAVTTGAVPEKTESIKTINQNTGRLANRRIVQ